ncbi:uncharacterized protein LOC106713023 [Papilio machaon]|uniref:uncharacterized protein LOC106713023 n=1 Tax=Papilio machaon TaxID=76193 RepID=UPI001E6653EE|nr:uncharacterized protein LOC106713023 [Papilio machaon]
MEECVVHGALAALLRIMRVVGMIPVRLVSVSGAFVVRYSFAQDVIARLFYACFCLLLLTWESVHLITPIFLINNTKKRSLLCLSVVAVIIRMTIIFYSVLKGFRRTKQLCRNINEIQKLNIEGIHDVAVVNVEKRRFKLFILFVAMSPIIHFVELFAAGDYAKNIKNDYLTLIRTYLYEFGFFVIVTLEGQFVFTILTVHTALQAVNRRLGKLLTDFKKNQERSNEISSAHRTLRQLATSYSTLCDVMRTLDEENGLIIFMSFISMLIAATLSIFFLVFYWSINPFTNMPYTGIELEKLTFIRMMQFCRCLYVFINIMFLLEPCQWTYNEMEVTRLFVTRLTHYAPTTSGPLINELEMFNRLVYTNIPSYSPLQLFTLKRSLILELWGTFTAWLIIVLHDKNTDKKE